MSAAPTQEIATHRLRFQSLFDPGRCFEFPCDEAGNVEIDELSGRACHNYLFARTMVGREFLSPTVVHAAAAPAKYRVRANALA